MIRGLRERTGRLIAVFGVLLLLGLPAAAQHGRGSGHGGGFGGHSGFGGGHAGGQSSSHSVGHAIGHLFGSHAGGGGNSESRGHTEEPPIVGAAMVHGQVVQLLGPGGRGVRPIRPNRPLTAFGFRNRLGFFGLAGVGFCSPFDGFFSGYAYASPFDCYPGDFYFDPYAGDGYAPDFGATQPPEGDASAALYDSRELAGFRPDVILENEPAEPVDKVPHHRRSAHEPDTILQLSDGTMYGLRDYWFADDRLYYVTNYGGQNAVPLSQIDVARTVQLNADRGEKITLPQAQNSAAN